MKRRISKNPAKALRARAGLKAAAEYKRATKARDGSQGAASPVRRIDPASIVVETDIRFDPVADIILDDFAADIDRTFRPPVIRTAKRRARKTPAPRRRRR